jgi:hypothetical protein
MWNEYQHGTYADILYGRKSTTNGALKNGMDTDVCKKSGTFLGFLLIFLTECQE